MGWCTKTITSPVGKKLLMALTGLSFVGFLCVHLIGNLTLYGGKETFVSYVEHLHELGPLVTVAEVFLLLLFLIHISTGLLLFFQNASARPKAYEYGKKNAGGRTLGSRTMPYTGILILVFIILHLITLRFIPQAGNPEIADVLMGFFAKPVYQATYIIAVILVAVHVSHGFWSAFQTIGANHPKYMPSIKKLGLFLSIVFAIGFATLPIFIQF